MVTAAFGQLPPRHLIRQPAISRAKRQRMVATSVLVAQPQNRLSRGSLVRRGYQRLVQQAAPIRHRAYLRSISPGPTAIRQKSPGIALLLPKPVLYMLTLKSVAIRATQHRAM